MMASGESGTIGCAVRLRGSAELRGTVAAVFRRAVLVRTEGAFLVLGDESVAPHPYAVTVPDTGARPFPGEAFHLTATELSIPGVLHLPVEGLREFTPRRSTPRLAAPGCVRGALAIALERVRSLPFRGGFHGLFRRPPEGDPLGEALLRIARQRTRQVREALRRRDRAALLESCEGLSGLGTGLTPSGDDYVAGVAAALRFLSESRGDPPPEGWLDLLAGSVESRTSGYSAFLVRCAARGQVSRPVSDWLEAILSGRREGVPAATDALVAMGHSSGVDAMAGMVHMLASMIEETPWIC